MNCQLRKSATESVSSSNDATMRITRGNDPLNVVIHDKFRLKTLGFNEWLEKFGSPPGVERRKGLVIIEPESGVFFYNGNFDLVFQREEEFHLTTTPQLVRLQNGIIRGTPKADEFFKKLEFTIEARNDANRARKIIQYNIDGMGQHIRIQVKYIIKEVKDYLKTYSSAGMDISWARVTNVPAFDKEDFTSWKVRFLVFLDGLEPYLLKTLEDGPFVPMPSLSTTKNPLPKCQNQWSNVETQKKTWNDLILAHEGPFDTRDTKIAALRLKFNAFKSLEGEKVNETFTRLKCLVNDLENNGVIIPQAELYWQIRKGSIKDLGGLDKLGNPVTNPKKPALLMGKLVIFKKIDYKGKYKGLKAEMAILTKRINDLTKRKSEKGKNEKGKSKKGLIAESFDWDDESISSEDERVTKIRAFMAITEDEPSVGKADARSGQ
ncbi:hypothetical protein Tco_0970505 [Tanacetum coccineum]